MKKNNQTIIFACACVFFIAALLFAHSRRPAVPPLCPFLYAQDSNYKVMLNGCTATAGEQGSYTAKTLTLEPVAGGSNIVYQKNTDFAPDGPPARIQEDPGNAYSFIDSGSSNVRNLAVLSLKDGRTTDISYLDFNPPVFTEDGYLLYVAPSTQFPNTHPEVEMSAATDVVALKLSDFTKQSVCQGDAGSDCYISGAVLPSGQDISTVIVEPTTQKIPVLKEGWNAAVPADAENVFTYFQG